MLEFEDKCCRCSNAALESHTCPYFQEINDIDQTCNCCSQCIQECANEI